MYWYLIRASKYFIGDPFTFTLETPLHLHWRPLYIYTGDHFTFTLETRAEQRFLNEQQLSFWNYQNFPLTVKTVNFVSLLGYLKIMGYAGGQFKWYVIGRLLNAVLLESAKNCKFAKIEMIAKKKFPKNDKIYISNMKIWGSPLKTGYLQLMKFLRPTT